MVKGDKKMSIISSKGRRERAAQRARLNSEYRLGSTRITQSTRKAESPTLLAKTTFVLRGLCLN